MDVQQFFSSDSENSIELTPVVEKHFEQFCKTLGIKERAWLESNDFQAKSGQICLLAGVDGRVKKGYLGLDDVNDLKAYASAATSLPKGKYLLKQGLNQHVALFWALAQYAFCRYKEDKTKPRQLVVANNIEEDYQAIAQAVFTTRDLINTPSNDMGPEQMAEFAKVLAKQYKAKFQQIVGDKLLKYNFPAIHAVGRASSEAPRLLEINWGNSTNPHVVLVGKGVCFDSGGLDLKPSSGMRLMKKDMGGAANALGLAQLIMQQNLPLHLTVLIPAVENAVSGNAYRPGDVIATRKGLSVEIDNTDAEGRVVLADALAYACEKNPKYIIDFATLTGAARVAVGTEIAAMFCDNDEIANQLYDLSKHSHDPVWRLPLYQPYLEAIKPKIADIANSAKTPYAGATTAALFLQQFVDEDIDWVHFDIMAYNTASKPGKPEGGEAMAIRTVHEYLKKLS